MAARHQLPGRLTSPAARRARARRNQAKTVPTPHPLTAAEIAHVAARYWAGWEVAQIATADASTSPVQRAARLEQFRRQVAARMRGYAGDGWTWSTRGSRVTVTVNPARAARQVRRAGTITLTLLIRHVTDRLTPQRIATLTAALAAERAHEAGRVDCPGPYPDTTTWWTEQGYAHARRAAQLQQAVTTAARAILQADLDTQLDLFGASV